MTAIETGADQLPAGALRALPQILSIIADFSVTPGFAREKAGRREVIWISALVGPGRWAREPDAVCARAARFERIGPCEVFGAWSGDNRPLAGFLTGVAARFTHELPFRFIGREPGCLRRVLRNADRYVTVVTSGTMDTKRGHLRRPRHLSPKLLWGGTSSITPEGGVSLGSRGTAVARWR